jgi:hypothetical protein
MIQKNIKDNKNTPFGASAPRSLIIPLVASPSALLLALAIKEYAVLTIM